MKKMLLLLPLLLFGFLVNGQELNEVWGIPMHADNETMKAIVKNKYCGVRRAVTTRNMYVYADCDFNGYRGSRVELYFHNDSLYEIDVLIYPEKAVDIVTLYKKIKSDITKKYWEPRAEIENYEKPFKKGDNKHVAAIRSGNASIMTIWGFPTESIEGINGEITLAVEKEVYVSIVYRDGIISNRLRDEGIPPLQEAR